MTIIEYVKEIIENEVAALNKISIAIDDEAKNLLAKFNSQSRIRSFTCENKVLGIFVARGNAILDAGLRQSIKEYINFINKTRELKRTDRSENPKNIEIINSRTEDVKEILRARLEKISNLTY